MARNDISGEGPVPQDRWRRQGPPPNGDPLVPGLAQERNRTQAEACDYTIRRLAHAMPVPYGMFRDRPMVTLGSQAWLKNGMGSRLKPATTRSGMMIVLAVSRASDAIR